VIRRLGFFFGCCLTVWAILFVPAWLLWPDQREVNLICTLTAGALCILPTALTMAWSLWGLKQNPQQQLLAVLGGTGVRMFFVLGFGLLLAYNIQVFIENPKTFWFWVLIFYLLTLTLEVGIIVVGQQKQLAAAVKPQQPAANEPSGS
jgi:hypothetical protein